jgi:hypothetical protein
MSKLIGSRNNQVPSNSTLGGGAYIDSDYFHVNNLSANSFTHNLPIAKPLVDFDFANSKTIPDCAVFRSASNGVTYVGKDGYIKYTTKTDQPRFTHKPLTGESLGLVIEGYSQNLFYYSNEIVGGSTSAGRYSTQTGTSVGTLSSKSPDGTSNAYYVATSENQVWSACYYDPNQAGTTGNVSLNKRFTHSAWVKYISGDPYINFYVWNYGSTSAGVYGLQIKYISADEVTLTPYESTNGGGRELRYGSEYYGNGWHRVWFSTYLVDCQNGNGYSEWNWNKEPVYDASGETTAGTSTTWGIWGQQLEENQPIPTSLIPTSGSVVTRTYDYCYVPNFDEILNGSVVEKDGMTMFFDGIQTEGPYKFGDRENAYDVNKGGGRNLYNAAMCVDQETSSYYWSLTRYRSGLYNTSGGYYSQAHTAGTNRHFTVVQHMYDPEKRIKLAGVMTKTAGTIYINGHKILGSSTSNMDDLSPTHLRIGNDVYAAVMYGTVRRATVWNTPLSEKELLALTENEESKDGRPYQFSAPPK